VVLLGDFAGELADAASKSTAGRVLVADRMVPRLVGIGPVPPG